jgi:hypothetical protein
MVKMKWGSAEEAKEIDAWEPDPDRQGYQEYTGPRPPKGMYRWRLDRLQASMSSGGFRQLIVHLVLDPHLPEHEKYRGKYMRDYIIVKNDTGFRVKPFLDVLGVTASQLYNQTDVTKEEGSDPPTAIVNRIAKVVPAGTLLYGRIWPDRNKPEYDRIEYVKRAEAGDKDTAGSDDSDDGNDGDPPF